MKRRSLIVWLIAVLSIPAAVFFITMPPWQIEHPGDPSLILHTERHWLWRAPPHAHLDFGAMVIPVLAIVMVAIALIVVAVYQEYSS